MLYRVCPMCGNKVKVGVACPCKKERARAYDREYRDKERAAFYHSREWKRLTALCKARDAGLDQFELIVNKRMVKGELSHHIIELSEDRSKALELDNLIYVSQGTHNFIHRVYNKSEEDKNKLQAILFEIIKRGGG